MIVVRLMGEAGPRELTAPKAKIPQPGQKSSG
jgi:hypothetical protein